MLSRLINIALCAGFMLLISSCASLTTIDLDILKPAQITVPPDVLSVVVVDNSLPYRGDKVHLISSSKGTLEVDTIWVDNFGTISTNALAESLKQKNYFDSVYYHSVPLNRNFENPYLGELPFSLIDSLCKNYNTQAVISLEAYRYQSKMNFLEGVDYYYVSLDVNSWKYWKMYRNNGSLMDAYLQKDSIFWDTSSTPFFNISSQLPSVRESVEVLAWHMGRNVSKRVAPYWDTVKRYYYASGNHLFVRANDLKNANNWEEAAKVWYYVYQNGTKPQKAKAALNLALSYEVRENYDEAVAWADISRQLFDKLSLLRISDFDKRAATLYYITLSERIQQKKRLDEQFGTNK